MKPYYLLICVFTIFFAGKLCAQEPQKAPDIYQQIEDEADRLQRILDLEDWQVFYVDSILNHDYRAMQEEMNSLSSAKVSNFDIYTKTSDKWAENIYVAFRKVLNSDQWAKYLKSGAARDRKAREKRKAKMEKSSAKLPEND